MKTKSSHRAALASLASLVIATGSALAQTTIHTATTTSDTTDTWNNVVSWDNGVPSGAGPWLAEVAASKEAHVTSASTPTYTGSLTLRSGSTLKMYIAAENINALGSGTITMETNSWLRFRQTQTRTISNPINLTGNARIRAGESTQGAVNLTLDGAITGLFNIQTTANGASQIHFNNTGNTYVGLSADAVSTNSWDMNWQVYGDSTGSLGDGDLTLNTLNLNGPAGTKNFVRLKVTGP